jgi:LmbE family N-acetylglucosaminyl deacetylase
MMKLRFPSDTNKPLHLLCIGAHSDDIEIGCGGTILTWLQSLPAVTVTWVVMSAVGERASEAKRSANALLRRAQRVDTVFGSFRDGYLPAQYTEVKDFFETLKATPEPDVILTHWLDDRHQDHRLVGELTWNTWRNHMILEYEIPKYEGDLKPSNVFVEVPNSLAKRKFAHLERHFASQRNKDWFAAPNFSAIMRLRGLECRSASGFAEAYHARKLLL